MVATQVCEVLERCGIPCWIAPRDVVAGALWDEAILHAIETTQAMVLILSEHANTSRFVKNEVSLAFSKGKTIFVFRTHDVSPAKSLELYLARHQWSDGFPPPVDEKVNRLAAAIAALLGKTVTGQSGPTPASTGPTAPAPDWFAGPSSIANTSAPPVTSETSIATPSVAAAGTVRFRDGRSKQATYKPFRSEFKFFRTDEYSYYIPRLVDINGRDVTSDMPRVLVNDVKTIRFIEMTSVEKQDFAKTWPYCDESESGRCPVRKATLVMRAARADDSKYQNVYLLLWGAGHAIGPEGQQYFLEHYDVVGFDF